MSNCSTSVSQIYACGIWGSKYQRIRHTKNKSELCHRKTSNDLTRVFERPHITISTSIFFFLNLLQCVQYCAPYSLPQTETKRTENTAFFQGRKSVQKQVLQPSLICIISYLGTAHELERAEMIVCSLRWCKCGLLGGISQPHACFLSFYLPLLSHSWVNSFHLLQIQPHYLFSEQSGFQQAINASIHPGLLQYPFSCRLVPDTGHGHCVLSCPCYNLNQSHFLLFPDLDTRISALILSFSSSSRRRQSNLTKLNSLKKQFSEWLIH